MQELKFENTAEQLRINGCDFSVEMDDVEIIDAFEKFRLNVIEISKEMQSRTNTKEAIHRLCENSIAAAENILGEGAAEKIFGDTINFRKCNQFTTFMLNAYTEHWNGITSEMQSQKVPTAPKHSSYGYKNKGKR